MNRLTTVSLLALVLSPALAWAQQASPQYPEWDKLSPAQREVLLAPLRDRWNSNPDERARMFERAQRWQQMPAEQRQRAREGLRRWEQMPEDQRQQARALFHAVRGMDPQARRAFLQQWQQMTPQQRADWMRTHPAPPPPTPPAPPSAPAKP
ncbi:MAG: DUF3106 domain-containing protein [Thermomonas hydrothermalis]|uniref:DUF3106 domain-containing protein n=1 Tax=Thermomonas hydrothermalis TaxID=213588 RepID=UPI0023572E09|nr:DUF3106 domain-containing protein [Thermomonas hydrothermalis]MCL6620117.1 DUF3106 domain-containing protein [Thermomonas hydrothermalis]